ncbi:MAG: Sua5/YciO/YrdC/YwlC family protein [Williamsia sp.]|nr:Sua5/YciO/YrdC/YwlC family protein [Williamsia sp.]
MIDFSADIENCLRVLKEGGLILYPTDTVWGLGCDATNEAAVEKLYALKQRPSSKQFILLLADERDLMKYITQPDPAVFDYLQTVQKPTTVVYDGVIGIAGSAVAEDGSAAFRIVKEVFCKNLIKRFRKPLVSTSANLSGETTPKLYGDISPAIKAGVDYIVQFRRDDLEVREPSAVVRWNGNGQVTVIRE